MHLSGNLCRCCSLKLSLHHNSAGVIREGKVGIRKELCTFKSIFDPQR